MTVPTARAPAAAGGGASARTGSGLASFTGSTNALYRSIVTDLPSAAITGVTSSTSPLRTSSTTGSNPDAAVPICTSTSLTIVRAGPDTTCTVCVLKPTVCAWNCTVSFGRPRKAAGSTGGSAASARRPSPAGATSFSASAGDSSSQWARTRTMRARVSRSCSNKCWIIPWFSCVCVMINSPLTTRIAPTVPPASRQLSGATVSVTSRTSSSSRSCGDRSREPGAAAGIVPGGRAGDTSTGIADCVCLADISVPRKG